ncbi:MAG: S41 family peptidase [Spirochaetales bacterium]|jgi:carboxyl-terminal processing protease|nr:S41 family peptidase [Spirochaetales bacterium]
MSRKKPLSLIGITLFLTFFICFLAFSPALHAQAASEKRNESRQYLSMLEFMFRYVLDNYVEEVSPQALYEGAARGLFEALGDPYSVYLTASDMADYSDTTVGEFGGLGMYISKNSLPYTPPPENPGETEGETFQRLHGAQVEVISAMEGTPAYRGGITAGDYITAINGEATDGLTMEEVLTRLRGPAGSEVTLEIARRGGINFSLPLRRAVITVPTIRYARLPNGISYIRIIHWNPHTREQVQNALRSLNAGRPGIILDVRGNPGGLLSSVVETADLFLNSGVIVSTRSRAEGESRNYTAQTATAVPMDVPLVVLIDKGSASASEILAGALGDSRRAVLVGDTTFGKGSVQWLRDLGSGGFKLTYARYYTPLGVNIDKSGIPPHLPIAPEEFTEEQRGFLQRLYSERQIPRFVEGHPGADEGAVAGFIDGLIREGIALDRRILARLIRDEYNRNLNDPPVFDLEYDTALKAASDMLVRGESPRYLQGENQAENRAAAP